jgi:predicted MPP superfamily phosphohydrolase
MVWHWFWSIINILMAVADFAWWILAMRVTNGRLWRILTSIFIGAQLAAFVCMSPRLNWIPRSYKPLFFAVILWHYFAVATLPFLFVVPSCVKIGRWILRKKNSSANQPISKPSPANTIPRREFIGACAALGPPLFTVGSTAFALAQLESLRVRRFMLPIPGLPPVLDGMTIAQVSDIHVGRVTSERMLRKMVSMTNSLRADVVLLTGDLINHELSDLSDGIELVKAMEGQYGQWMIEGNHDVRVDGAEFCRRVKQAGIPLLLDESATGIVRGFPVQFFGLRWMNAGDRMSAQQVKAVLKERLAEAFPILLAHHPHAFDAAVQEGLPLTLAGHTHGGQLMFDKHHGVGPAMFRYWSGLYARGNSQMIVSNGVGNWFPLRVNAPAEIVHITLRSA